jgi:hypothetical protein
MSFDIGRLDAKAGRPPILNPTRSYERGWDKGRREYPQAGDQVEVEEFGRGEVIKEWSDGYEVEFVGGQTRKVMRREMQVTRLARV